ncbi:MAG: chromosomal replication initiator protein DnaA [Candidatus Kerfeldbacteria bacterium]|nr:chromosomal replication initiator protein DnaA [Candidatus Kerfeldbacteria bacterium]
MSNNELWKAVLGELELLLSRANFTTWFKNTFITSRDGRKVVVGVPNEFTKAWLEKKYHAFITKALQNVTKEPIEEILYSVESMRDARPETERSTEVARPRVDAVTESNESGLNPRYTFETFVVGKRNELARAACFAVVDKPGKAYNPLFIYGDSGLGKTHLLHAIGNAFLGKARNQRLLYTSCEQFTNDFIQSVKKGTSPDFKDRYRTLDVLLIDDIAFLAGKEGTQEEFFHTFNALHGAKKQIVITCDRPPKSIPGLESRLLSRFEWGMIADIGAPDLETRIAILEAKAQERAFPVDQEILQHIASNTHSNVRELEGALNRLIAYHELNNTSPTLESTKQLLASISGEGRRSGLTPKQLITTVAGFFDVSIEDLVGNSRKKELVTPRQIAMYLLREELKSSFPSIGNELGGRDHTTAMHACTKIAAVLERDERMKRDVHHIRQRLYV